jgi:hypothetical protein
MLPRLTTPLLATAITLACASALPAHAGEVYGALGLPGATLGYAHTVNASLGLRVDASTTGSYKKNGTESGIDYQGKAKYNRVGLFADYFPFTGRFRVSAPPRSPSMARPSPRHRLTTSTPRSASRRSRPTWALAGATRPASRVWVSWAMWACRSAGPSSRPRTTSSASNSVR